jgi:hypothetical protein
MRDLDDIWAELQPWLETMEARRKKAMRRSVIVSIAMLPASIVLWAILRRTGLGGEPSVFIAVAACLTAMTLIHLPVRIARMRAKEGVATRIAAAYGLRYELRPAPPDWFEAVLGHGLLPREHDHALFEDALTGELHGADFEMCEAQLIEMEESKKGAPRQKTVFRGALIRIAFPRTIEGVTLIARDRGAANMLDRWSNSRRSGGKLKRVGLVDPKFEDVFEVYGTDQVMARYLVTPTFMERLLELEAALEGSNVRAVFDDSLKAGFGKGELLIAADTGNLFEVARKGRIDTRETLETIHEDIALIAEIIAIVLEPPKIEATA